MKTKLSILLCLFLGKFCAQTELPLTDGKVNYSEVVETSKKSKEQLYKNAKAWYEENFKAANTILKDDKAAGEIAAKGLVKLYKTGGKKDIGSIHYVVSVSVKEGKYKYSITDLVHKDATSTNASGGKLENEEPRCGTKNLSMKAWEEVKMMADEEIKKIAEELKKTMAAAGVGKGGSDDW